MTTTAFGDPSAAEQREALLVNRSLFRDGDDPTLDALTQAVAEATHCPIALVSALGADSVTVKSRHGVEAVAAAQLGSFCLNAAASGDLMQVREARLDARFADDAGVVGSPLIRFYAGLPLCIDGACVATLAVMDRRSRLLDTAEEASLRAMGAAVVALLAERRLRASDAARADGLERSPQAQGEFMSRVSHELRTPLNAVLGFAQVLRTRGATQPRAEIVKSATQIVRAGGHLLSLIDDLLGLASLDAGHPDLPLAPVALLPLAQRCAGLMEAHAEAQQMRIDIDAEPDLPTASGDVRAVQQVLFNLLGNAVKYGQPNTTVQIRLTHDKLAGRLLIAVADQGRGIAADQLAAIFEPFTRLHGGPRSPVGSGLGLAISRKLVTAMGGEIGVASEPGQGSVFTVGLPVDGRAALPTSSDSSFAGLNDLLSPLAVGAAALTMPTASPADARVLYIEDDPVNALLMQEFFRAMPSAVARAVLDVVENGLDGLSMASHAPPDLILLDMNLPDLHGSEVLRRLRADPRTARIPVVAVSADAMVEQINGAKRDGFDGYWTKPIDIRLVHAEIARRFAPQPTG